MTEIMHTDGMKFFLHYPSSKNILTVVCAITLLMPTFVHATFYTNENFLFTYHYKPVSFAALAGGGFKGTLENGTTFTQTPVLTDRSLRLHKFMVDDAFFYISDKGTFQASSDLAALSIYTYIASA